MATSQGERRPPKVMGEPATAVPWWKEPDGRLRFCRRLARVDAGCVRLHGLPADHASDSRDIQRIDHGRDVRVYNHAVDAAGGGRPPRVGSATGWAARRR